MLNRNQILKNTKLKQEVVTIPEWEGDVVVREMTGAERAEIEVLMAPAARGGTMPPEYTTIRAKVATWVCLDEQGNRLFNADDVKALSDSSAAAVDRIWKATVKLSGMNEKGKEEAQKKSPSQSSDSGTSLPSPSEA